MKYCNRYIKRGMFQRAVVAVMAVWLTLSPSLAAERWIDVVEKSLVIVPGSALDFSRFNEYGVAGAKGRIVNIPDKGFRTEGDGLPLGLHCASLALSPATGGFPKGKDAEAYAAQLRARGYNIARFHYVEATVMSKRDKDFDFDPVELDAWFYFLSVLKRHGIYWVVDAMSSENGAVGAVYPHRWVRKFDFKRRIYFDVEVQEHWKKLVTELLARKNPYTGKSTLQDEALLGVITVNEGGINHLAGQRNEWPDGLREAFNVWLKERYKNDSTIQQMWGDLAPDEKISDLSIRLPRKLRERTPRMRDVQRFITSLEVGAAGWMQDYLRELGYRGNVTGLDSWPSRQADVSRASFEWVDMHGYHDENFGISPGTRIEQTSSLVNAGRYLRWMAASRQRGKPFSVTEYGQPFWNSYRYEASLMAPAMASLQNWEFICLHGEGAVDLSLNQVVSRKRSIHPYGVGIDPITIAGETLAALLMRRGDISPAKRNLLINFSGSEFAGEPVDIIEDEISSLSWLLRMEIDVSQRLQSGSGFDFIIEPSASQKTLIGRALGHIPIVQSLRADSVIDALKALKVLPHENRSKATSGIFESETGEVLMDRSAGVFQVVTPRTIAFSTNKPIDSLKLGALRVSALSSPALVAVSSLDDKPLNISERMLVVFATDAQNSGMSFSDSKRSVLNTLGLMPPQILGASMNLYFETAIEHDFELSALMLTGVESSLVPLERSGRLLKAKIDNSSGGRGTLFYLLKRK